MAVSGFVGVSALFRVIAGFMANGRKASFCVHLDQEIIAETLEECGRNAIRLPVKVWAWLFGGREACVWANSKRPCAPCLNLDYAQRLTRRCPAEA
jgi:hypothetical protein